MTVQSNRFQIVLPQDFTQWQWYNKPEIVHFFIHCLFKANKNDRPMENMLIKRGSFVSCLDTLKEETGLSVQQLRSCIKKLVATNELTSTSTNRYRIITILNYDNYTADQQAGNKPINRHINRQENVAMQENQGFCDSAIGKSTSTSTGNYDNVNNCSEVIYDTDQQTSNKQINSPINRQEQRNEKETKKAKEVFPPAPPIQEKEINKEKEKKNNVFFPLTSEKCVFNAASGEKNAQSQNEMKNDFSKQNLSSELENKFATSTQNFSTTTHQNEKNDFESQKKFDSLTARKKFSQSENFSEKEKSCGKKEKELPTSQQQNEQNNNQSLPQSAIPSAQSQPTAQANNFIRIIPQPQQIIPSQQANIQTQQYFVDTWAKRLNQIKNRLISSSWIENVSMNLQIPIGDMQTIFESFCFELVASDEHSTLANPENEIKKHFFYWAKKKKETLAKDKRYRPYYEEDDDDDDFDPIAFMQDIYPEINFGKREDYDFVMNKKH
jgi:hypothetical protein